MVGEIPLLFECCEAICTKYAMSIACWVVGISYRVMSIIRMVV